MKDRSQYALPNERSFALPSAERHVAADLDDQPSMNTSCLSRADIVEDVLKVRIPHGGVATETRPEVGDSIPAGGKHSEPLVYGRGLLLDIEVAPRRAGRRRRVFRASRAAAHIAWHKAIPC
jgi:hypothetical protein